MKENATEAQDLTWKTSFNTEGEKTTGASQ
jgi:hypothetical protein